MREACQRYATAGSFILSSRGPRGHTPRLKLVISQSTGFLLSDRQSAVLCRAAYVISDCARDNESEEQGIVPCTYS